MSKKRIIFKQKIIMHTNNSNKKIYIKIKIKEIIVWIFKNLMSAVFFSLWAEYYLACNNNGVIVIDN